MSTITRNRSLDGLRGLAVLYVWLSHSSGRGQLLSEHLNFHGIGHIGVMLFFSLSGFLLAKIIFESEKKFDFTLYFKRRFLRIAPLFYIVVTFVLILQAVFLSLDRQSLYVTEGWTGYIKHLLFIKGDGIFWTIPAEFVFYLILPFAALLILKVGERGMFYLFCFAIFYGVYAIAVQIGYIDRQWALLLIDIPKNSQYLDVFLMGVIFAAIPHSDIYKFYKKHQRIIDILAVLLFTLAIVLPFTLVTKSFLGFERPFYEIKYISLFWGLIFSFIILSAYEGNRLLVNILSVRPLVYLGVVSYSWYLLHLLVLRMTNSIELESSLLAFTVSSLLLVAVTYFTYTYIEKPFIMLGKSFSIPQKHLNSLS